MVERWVARCAKDREADRFTQGLYLYGPPGAGKTHLACAAIIGLARLGVPAFFAKVADLPRDDQGAVAELANAADCPVLALDDVGTEKLTPRMQEILLRIVDGRLWTQAPTIVTSNLELADLGRRFDDAEGAFDGCGQRIVGRLLELCVPVHVDAADKRMEALGDG